MALPNTEIVMIFISSFAMSAIMTSLFRRIAIRLNIFDRPNQKHKTHQTPVPYLGGLSVMATVCGGLTFFILRQSQSIIDIEQIVVLILVPFVLAIIGLVDDLKNVGAFSRLLFQIFFAIIIAVIFSRFGWFGEPTDSLILNVVVSILWIVGITNAFNFIDNLDGGAGGIAVIVGLSLTIAASSNSQLAVAVTSSLVAGASLGFLVWNLHPARIYLGDSGAFFLGALLSVLTLTFDPTSTQPVASWYFALLIFAIPIMDTVLVVISRLMRGISPFTGGKDHISHRLIKLGMSKHWAAVTLWISQVYFSALGLLVLFASSQTVFKIQLVSLLSWVLIFLYIFRLAPIEIETEKDKRAKAGDLS